MAYALASCDAARARAHASVCQGHAPGGGSGYGARTSLNSLYTIWRAPTANSSFFSSAALVDTARGTARSAGVRVWRAREESPLVCWSDALEPRLETAPLLRSQRPSRARA